MEPDFFCLVNCHDSLKGRVVEVSLGDLKPNAEDEAFRKFQLKIEEIQV